MTAKVRARTTRNTGKKGALSTEMKLDTWGIVYEEGYPSSTLSKLKSVINRNTASGKIGGSKNKAKIRSNGGHWTHQQHNAAFVKTPAHLSRRVTIKMRISQHTKKGAVTKAVNASRGKKVLRLHLKYIQRDGVSRDKEAKAELYTQAEKTMDAQTFLDIAKDDEYHFRMIVSPEDGKDLDLTRYTQDLLREMEKDLGTRLEWVAVNHYNTDNPHTHVIIRGVDETGQALVIPPDYISHGIRARASEIATRELGHLHEIDLDQRITKTLTLDQFTYTDRQLIEFSKDNKHVVNLLEIPNDKKGFYQHHRFISRLHHLRDLGLAREESYGHWRIDDALEEKLRALKLTQEMKQVVALHIDQPRHVLNFDKDLNGQEPIVGRVSGFGVAEEIIDKGYLIIDGVDGNAHYVPYWIPGKALDFEEGDIVQVKVQKPAPLETKADHNLIDYGAGKDVVYDPEKHRRFAIEKELVTQVNASQYIDRHLARLQTLENRGIVELREDGRYLLPKDMQERHERFVQANDGKKRNWQRMTRLDHGRLDELVNVRAPTLLDRQLIDKSLGDIKHTNYGATLSSAMEKRQAWLIQQKLAYRSRDGQFVAKPDMMKQLVRMEFMEVQADLAEKGRKLVDLHGRERFDGKAKGVKSLRSGSFLEIQRGERDLLYVPMRREYRAFIGKDVQVGRDRVKTQEYRIKLASDRQQKLFR